MNIEIFKATPETCYKISLLIPEFSDQQYDLQEFTGRVKNKQHIALVALCDGIYAGFKIGYEAGPRGVFYSWMGGVIPFFRKFGIARALATEQENQLKELGFNRVTFKTRNYLKPMLIFALKNGFDIVEVEVKENSFENRIYLEKRLI